MWIMRVELGMFGQRTEFDSHEAALTAAQNYLATREGVVFIIHPDGREEELDGPMSDAARPLAPPASMLMKDGSVLD